MYRSNGRRLLFEVDAVQDVVLHRLRAQVRARRRIHLDVRWLDADTAEFTLTRTRLGRPVAQLMGTVSRWHGTQSLVDAQMRYPRRSVCESMTHPLILLLSLVLHAGVFLTVAGLSAWAFSLTPIPDAYPLAVFSLYLLAFPFRLVWYFPRLNRWLESQPLEALLYRAVGDTAADIADGDFAPEAAAEYAPAHLLADHERLEDPEAHPRWVEIRGERFLLVEDDRIDADEGVINAR